MTQLPSIPLRRLGYMAAPSLFVRQETSITLDAWQAAVLDDTAQFIAVEAPRQSGKSTVASAAAVITASITAPGGSVILVAVSERQARLLLRRCRDFMKTLGEDFKVAIESVSESRIRFENGSTIEALPVGVDGQGDSVRGATASLVVIDEAAFALVDSAEGSCPLLAALIPMVTVSKGRIMLITSAGYVGSPAYRIIKEGEGNWSCHSVPTSMCPRHTPEILAGLRETLGEVAYQREVELVWGGAGLTPISLSAARGARDDGDYCDMEALVA